MYLCLFVKLGAYLRKVQSHTGIAVLSVMLTLKGVLWIVPIAYIKHPARVLS